MNIPGYQKVIWDMEKSCIWFKKINDIPYELVAKLAKKINVQDWIKLYKSAFRK